MPTAEISSLALALGRIPTGLYVVSTHTSGSYIGFVASFVMQVAFDPPTVCVAIARERPLLDALRKAGVFAISVLDERSTGLMPRFLKRPAGDRSPFDSLNVTQSPGGCPVLADGLAWIECRYSGEHDAGDHVVIFGKANDGRVLREGDSAVHFRRSGFVY